MENNKSLEFRIENLERETIVHKTVINALVADKLENPGELERKALAIEGIMAQIMIEKFAQIEDTIANSVIEKLNAGIGPLPH